MPIPQISIILLSIFLLLTPIAIWAEQTYFDAWHSRLILPELIPSIAPNTPRMNQGTLLPNTINNSITLTLADNPIILTSKTTISSSGKLSLEPGARIFTNTMSEIIVNGALNINGTYQQPVLFTTNEQHPNDQTWLGITTRDTGQTTAAYTTIKYGSPGISCLMNSQVNISNAVIQIGSLGIFSESPNCSINNSFINGVYDGIISRGAKPTLNNVKIDATHKDITNYDN